MSQTKVRHIFLQSFGEPYHDLELYSQKQYMARVIKLLLEPDAFSWKFTDWHTDWYDDAQLFAGLGDLFASAPPAS